MNLEEQLNNFINKHVDKDKCISAKEFKQMFILGFARQLQLDVEQFFEFNVIDTKDGNCQIIARLKQNNETVCHILKEFFLKDNFSQVKQMFGVPNEVDITDIGDGIIEI